MSLIVPVLRNKHDILHHLVIRNAEFLRGPVLRVFHEAIVDRWHLGSGENATVLNVYRRQRCTNVLNYLRVHLGLLSENEDYVGA